MLKRQKGLLVRFIVVIVLTTAMVFAVTVMKDRLNKSESLVAMTDLTKKIWEYRKQTGSWPDENYVESLEDELLGSARTGKIYYRKKWINYASGPTTVLAYTKKEFGFFWPDGYVVVRLNGKVQWLTESQFNNEMALQWGRNEERH